MRSTAGPWRPSKRGATVNSESYDEDEEDREFFEQALVEGEVLVFNTWPRGDEDDDEEEEDEEDGDG